MSRSSVMSCPSRAARTVIRATRAARGSWGRRRAYDQVLGGATVTMNASGREGDLSSLNAGAMRWHCLEWCASGLQAAGVERRETHHRGCDVILNIERGLHFTIPSCE